jgi:hypothetical protein
MRLSARGDRFPCSCDQLIEREADESVYAPCASKRRKEGSESYVGVLRENNDEAGQFETEGETEWKECDSRDEDPA